jgi:hypothetical protein
MDFAGLVKKTVLGIEIDAYVTLVSLELVEFVEHVILEQDIMVRIVYVTWASLEIEIYVLRAIQVVVNAVAHKQINAYHVLMLH